MSRADLRDPKKRSDGDPATLKTPPNASTKTNLEKGGLHPVTGRPRAAPLAARALLGYIYIYIYIYVFKALDIYLHGLGMPKSGYMIFNTWFCSAWPTAWPAAWSAACRALFAALLKI